MIRLPETSIEGLIVSILLEPPATPRPGSAANGRPLRPAEPGCWIIPTAALSLNGFRAWVTSDDFPEKTRVTYVDQEIYLDKSKEDLITHAAVKAEVSRVLLQLVRERGLGRLMLDGILVTNEKAGVSNNPDGVFLSLNGLQSDRFRFLPSARNEDRSVEIEGAPDWVLEIVSDSSVQKDTVKLRHAYFQAGIPEYWLIDARGNVVSFDVLGPGTDGYEPTPVEDGWRFSQAFGRAFRLERRQDAFGWEYTLEIKEVT